MDFNLNWEMATGGETKSGTETINAESVLDALELFFSNWDNKNKKLVGITRIYEESK